MNCLDIRRILNSDPHASTAEIQAHLAQCPACRQFAARQLSDDAILQAALALPVPEHLQERILLQRTLVQAPRQRMVRRATWGLAASVVLSVGLWWARPAPEQAVAWAEVILAHAIGEPAALTHTKALPQGQFQAALADYGLKLKGELGTLRYFGHCALPGGRGIHAVIDSPDLGQISLILPPRGTHAAPGKAQGEGFSAQMMQIEQTSIGLVSQRPEKMPEMERRIRGLLG